MQVRRALRVLAAISHWELSVHVIIKLVLLCVVVHTAVMLSDSGALLAISHRASVLVIVRLLSCDAIFLEVIVFVPIVVIFMIVVDARVLDHVEEAAFGHSRLLSIEI